MDLLIDTGRALIPFEIKLHSSPDKQMTRGLQNCMADLRLSKGYIVYPGDDEYSLGNTCVAIGMSNLIKRLPAILDVL